MNSVEFTDRETMLRKMNPSRKSGKIVAKTQPFKPDKSKGKYKEAMKRVIENRGKAIPKPMPKPPSGGKYGPIGKKPGKPGKPVKIPADKGRPVSGRPVSGMPGMTYRNQKQRVMARLKKMNENA